MSGNSAAKEATSPIAAVVCIDIQDPTNLGTILRTAEAFGVAAVVLGGDGADPFSRRVLRVSMGAALQLPIAHSTDLASDLAVLRQREKMSLIAAVADSTGEPFDGVDPPDRFAILLGNESSGLSPQWLDLCDRRVTIPMTPRADSLNVAVATGILLYHFCKPTAG
jgi:tRNA G18 (ribose-2'-O)-methylase SpoU